MHENEEQKKRLADALQRMTGVAPTDHPAPVEPPTAAQSPPSPQPRVRPAVPILAGRSSDHAGDHHPSMIDDDRVAVPAPSMDAFLSRQRRTSQPKKANPSLKMRRTIVPILLTLGVMLPLLGGLWFLTDADSPFRSLHIAVPISLLVIGVVLFVLAILNALHIGHIMRNEPTAQAK